MWDSSEGRPCEPEEGRGEPERSIVGSPGPDGSPASSGRGSGWLEEGRGGALHAERIFFLRHTLKGLLWMDLDFFIVGLDWIGCYKFCFEFGLDEDFFRRTVFWIPTFGFWLPVHSKE